MLAISHQLVKWALVILMLAGSGVHANEPALFWDGSKRQFSQSLQPTKSAMLSARPEARALHKAAPDPVPPPRTVASGSLPEPSQFKSASYRTGQISSQLKSTVFRFLPPSQGPPFT